MESGRSRLPSQDKGSGPRLRSTDHLAASMSESSRQVLSASRRSDPAISSTLQGTLDSTFARRAALGLVSSPEEPQCTSSLSQLQRSSFPSGLESASSRQRATTGDQPLPHGTNDHHRIPGPSRGFEELHLGQRAGDASRVPEPSPRPGLGELCGQRATRGPCRAPEPSTRSSLEGSYQCQRGGELHRVLEPPERPIAEDSTRGQRAAALGSQASGPWRSSTSPGEAAWTHGASPRPITPEAKESFRSPPFQAADHRWEKLESRVALVEARVTAASAVLEDLRGMVVLAGTGVPKLSGCISRAQAAAAAALPDEVQGFRQSPSRSIDHAWRRDTESRLSLLEDELGKLQTNVGIYASTTQSGLVAFQEGLSQLRADLSADAKGVLVQQAQAAEAQLQAVSAQAKYAINVSKAAEAAWAAQQQAAAARAAQCDAANEKQAALIESRARSLLAEAECNFAALLRQQEADFRASLRGGLQALWQELQQELHAPHVSVSSSAAAQRSRCLSHTSAVKSDREGSPLLQRSSYSTRLDPRSLSPPYQEVQGGTQLQSPKMISRLQEEMSAERSREGLHVKTAVAVARLVDEAALRATKNGEQGARDAEPALSPSSRRRSPGRPGSPSGFEQSETLSPGHFRMLSPLATPMYTPAVLASGSPGSRAGSPSGAQGFGSLGRSLGPCPPLPGRPREGPNEPNPQLPLLVSPASAGSGSPRSPARQP